MLDECRVFSLEKFIEGYASREGERKRERKREMGGGGGFEILKVLWGGSGEVGVRISREGGCRAGG